MASLFMMNVPYDCTESELSHWVESFGFSVHSVRLVRDVIAGVSPSFAYVEIAHDLEILDAISRINGHSIRNRVIVVSQARRAAPAA
ncbi:MAG TPA: RNA-binding protein [Terriglobia bacterium]|nr:RNA-binding protein [Terriglobia bacterium]